MNRRIAIQTLRSAISKGAVQDGPFTADWDVSGRCLMPVARSIAPRKERSFTRVLPTRLYDPEDGEWVAVDQIARKVYADDVGPVELRLMVKCRKCDNCLAERRTLWARRAFQEVADSGRTWFATFTLSPQFQEHFANLARLRCERRGNGVFEALPHSEQFLLRHEQIGKEFTKMFKIMRKAGMQFRYFMVVEPHLSSDKDEGEEVGQNFGLPHYHALIHERGAEISKRALEPLWKFGFTKFRLIDKAAPKEVWYVAKYLGKSSSARVRASLNFGSSVSVSTEEKIDYVSFLREQTDLKSEAVSGLGEAGLASAAQSADPPAPFTALDYLNCTQGV